MPLPGFVTTDSGLPKSHSRAPILSGNVSEGTSSGPGPLPIIGGFIPVQSAGAVTTSAANTILNQVVSTLAARIGAASFVYVPQTTASIVTSSFAGGDSAPNYTSVGAALIWDAGNRRLNIYSTAGGSGTWLAQGTLSSGTIVSTAAANVAAANYMYIPQTTGGIATSSFAGGDSAPNQAPPLGAALIWDAGNARLGIYSTASGSGVWLFIGRSTSGAASFTSSA